MGKSWNLHWIETVEKLEQKKPLVIKIEKENKDKESK